MYDETTIAQIANRKRDELAEALFVVEKANIGGFACLTLRAALDAAEIEAKRATTNAQLSRPIHPGARQVTGPRPVRGTSFWKVLTSPHIGSPYCPDFRAVELMQFENVDDAMVWGDCFIEGVVWA